MPNKEALIRKLSAMSGSRKAEAPTESNSGRRFEDDEAQLYEYDKVLRAALREKNPQAFDQYLSTIANTRKEKWARMVDVMSRHDDASKKAGALQEMYKKESYNPPIAEGFNESLSESEMKSILGEKNYAHFQKLRQRPESAKYLKGYGDVRVDYSKYEPIDLNVTKKITGADGYVGKATPVEVVKRPILTAMMIKR